MSRACVAALSDRGRARRDRFATIRLDTTHRHENQNEDRSERIRPVRVHIAEIVAYETLTRALDVLHAAPRRITYLRTQDRRRSLSFDELRHRALGILHHLQERGLKRQDHLIVLLNDNEQFIDIFWACLYGGIVPVPIALGVSDEQRFKLFRVFKKLPQAFLYTERANWHRLRGFAQSRGVADVYDRMRSQCLLTDDIHDVSHAGRPEYIRAQDTAFIQFSSGSTSEPKGIVLTHANLAANIRDIIRAAQFTPDDVSLSWMPLTHDMGLIGFHLNMLVCGMDHYIMDTEVFIRRPLNWMQVASTERANILCSPNFGYRHFLNVFNRRGFTTGDAEFDLSHVRLIFNGAEPISVSLCEEFLQSLSALGLRRNAMFPVYGLAEASLAVSFPRLGSALHYREIDRQHVALGDSVRFSRGNSASMQCVSVGHAIGDCEVRIAAADGEPLPEATVGRVLIKGPNVTQGYYLDAAATEAAITSDGWLDTGDLGFVERGELFITGRLKDVLFVNGQNFYAHDLEAVALQSGRLELGKVAVGGHRDATSESDSILVFVLHRGAPEEFVSTAREIAGYINEHTGAEVSEVIPVPRIPKTTSGKIQRFALVRAYAEGEFDRELAELRRLAASLREELQEPLSDVERELLEICSRTLDGIRLGRHDNFFETGASSLKLIEIHEQIDERYPGRIDLADMFDHPTLSELAAFIEQSESAI